MTRTPSSPVTNGHGPGETRNSQLLPVAALARLTLRALITNWRAQRVPQRRDYLLAHAKDDWTNVDRRCPHPETTFSRNSGRAGHEPVATRSKPPMMFAPLARHLPAGTECSPPSSLLPTRPGLVLGPLVSASGLARTPSRAPQDRSSVREGDAEQALSTAARKLRRPS